MEATKTIGILLIQKITARLRFENPKFNTVITYF